MYSLIQLFLLQESFLINYYYYTQAVAFTTYFELGKPGRTNKMKNNQSTERHIRTGEKETYKNGGDKRMAFSKLNYGVSEEEHTMTNMIFVIRINILAHTVLANSSDQTTGPGVTV